MEIEKPDLDSSPIDCYQLRSQWILVEIIDSEAKPNREC